jgi:hypothetical protein
MKTYVGVGVQTHVFLSSALVGSKWSAACSGQFIFRERVRDTHWIGDWAGPRAGLNGIEKWQSLTLSGIELRTSGVQVVGSRYTNCAKYLESYETTEKLHEIFSKHLL